MFDLIDTLGLKEQVDTYVADHLHDSTPIGSMQRHIEDTRKAACWLMLGNDLVKAQADKAGRMMIEWLDDHHVDDSLQPVVDMSFGQSVYVHMYDGVFDFFVLLDDMPIMYFRRPNTGPFWPALVLLLANTFESLKPKFLADAGKQQSDEVIVSDWARKIVDKL